MTVKNKTDLQTYINTNLADNNAALISAEDVRTSIYDTVDSLEAVVSSGDFDASTPFVNNVRAASGVGGWFIPEQGINFVNGLETVKLQTEAYPGPGGIDHNDLTNRGANDCHTQYLTIDGSRLMEENLPMGEHWIGASGAGSDKGLKFVTNGAAEDIHVGTSGSFVYGDGSTQGSAMGVAKAWIMFDGSGGGGSPVVSGHYNVSVLERLDVGKYKISVPSGVLKDANFVAIGSSNSRTSAGSQEDFERNTVGCVDRDFTAGVASVTFLVLNEQGAYVDAQINDLTIYGLGPNDVAQPAPTIIG